MTNLLHNPGFEAEWAGSHRVLVCPGDGDPYESDVGNIFTPPGWTTWFRHQEVNPSRMRSGEKGYLLFTFHRKHDAGLFQQVRVEPGAHLRFTIWAHAWSNHSDPQRPGDFPQPDDPRWSEGAGFSPYFGLESSTADDNLRNFTFQVGIDPTGGTDPTSDSVVWGWGVHIYNAFGKVEVEAEAESDVVTVFTRSRTLWAFKHNDAYWDDATLEVVGAPQPPDPDPGEVPVVARGSKAGLHAILSDDVASIANRLKAAGAPLALVKAVDDPSYLNAAREAGALTMFRKTSGVEGCGGVNDPGADLGGMADELFAQIAPYVEQYRDVVDWWEICNEPLGGGVATAAYVRLAELMKVCMVKAETRGIRLGLFAFNAGTPEWADMVAMAETGVFQAAYEGGHVVTTHEGVFDGDPIDRLFGDVIPGAPAVERAGALCGRYRYWMEAIRQAGSDCPPLVVSEFYDGSGYADDAEAIARFGWYDELVSQDAEVLAFTGFTWGPTSAWVKRDYGFLTERLIEYNLLVKERQNATRQPDLPPPVADGRPREPYKRVYHVLDPSRMSVDEMLEVVQGLWGRGEFVTLGPSYDDGMAHFGLSDVEAHLYGIAPDERPAFEAFRDRWYPLARLVYEDLGGVEPPDPDPPPAEGAQPVVGLHDEAGGEYLRDRVDRACCLIPVLVRDRPVDLDYRHLKGGRAEMFVIARLSYSWARPAGEGTLPPPTRLAAHVDALVETIQRARGVDAFQLWNEVNNASEHPPGYKLTPTYVANAYSQVWERAHNVGQLAPPPVDPYYGPGSDNRVWNEVLLNSIPGAHLLISHAGKSQTNAPASIWSDVQFGDEPLTWQYLNSKTLYTWMLQVPDRFRALPVVLGEVNPQHQTEIGGALGWVPGNAEWVREFMRFVRDWNGQGQQVTHAVVYRWGYDPWAVEGDGEILGAVVEEAGKRS
jgi:hypothetical protein